MRGIGKAQVSKAKRQSVKQTPAPSGWNNKSSKPKSSSRKTIGKPTVRKSKKAENEKAVKATEQPYKRFYADLRLKAKAANERMRQLEKASIKSPAYQSVQARLAILGRERKGDRGRRFSETGKATYNEMEKLNKILNDFLYGQETSTIKGAKEYMDNVWNSANKNNALEEAGISREDWLNFWESMPNKEKDRLYDSNESVLIIQAYSMKNGELSADNKYSMEEIADIIQTSKNLKEAYKKLDLNFEDIDKAQSLGAL